MELYQGTNYPDGCRWVCWKKNKKSGRKCNIELSVWKGTIFEDTHLSIPEMVSDLFIAFIYSR